MEHGTTRRRKSATGEKYSTREPVLELSFLQAQKILRRKALVPNGVIPAGAFRSAPRQNTSGRKRRGSAPPPSECGGSHRKTNAVRRPAVQTTRFTDPRKSTPSHPSQTQRRMGHPQEL